MEVLVGDSKTWLRCTTLVQVHRCGAAGCRDDVRQRYSELLIVLEVSLLRLTWRASCSCAVGFGETLMGRVSATRAIRGGSHDEGLGGSRGDRIVPAGGSGDRVRDVGFDSVLPGDWYRRRRGVLGASAVSSFPLRRSKLQTSRLRHGCLRRGRGKRGVLPLFLLAVLLLAHSAVEPALVAAQEQKKQVIATGGIYRRPLGHDPETLDPARITDIYSRSVSQQIFDGLVQFDQTLTVAPALAEFWRASRDGLTWTFTLRKGVRFHNGREMTAEDVVYSLARLLDPKTRSGAADLFSNVRGGREFREGRAKSVAGLVAQDRYTVQVTLEEAAAPFVAVLAVGHAKIVPKDVVEQLGDAFGSQPVGTGPFKFERWERGKEIVLAANADYFGGSPHLSRVVYRIFAGERWEAVYEEFQRGNLEDAPVPSRDYRRVVSSGGHIYVKRPMIGVRFYGINTRLKPLDDRRVRQALVYAINREAIVEEVFLGRYIPARGVLPPGTQGFNPGLTGYPYDPRRARELLAEAGRAVPAGRAARAGRRAAHPDDASHLRTALPAVRAERRGERPRRPVHPVAESLARATAMKLRSLRTKLLLGTLLVIAFVMTAVMVVVDHRQRAAIIAEVQRRGEVIARNLAAISYGPLLLYNYTALEQNVARVAGEADVVYALVLDAAGRVAAHSRDPERVGAVLEGLVHRRAALASELLVQETVTSRGEAIYDFAVPVQVEGRKWGTIRVGPSQQRMEAEIGRTRLELGALTLVVLLLGGLAAALVARRIARPVQRLAEGAAAISRGELAQRIEPTTADEIGGLAAAFNHMAVQLVQQRGALEDANAELQRHVVELVDLKSYTDNILASLTSGIVSVDLDGRVVTLNPVAELLTGFFKGEVAGRYCSEAFAHTPQLSDILMETLASHAPIASVPLTLRRRNGSTVPLELSTAPLKGGEGKDLGVIGVLRDLTLVRQLEHDLRRSDQLAALGTLAAGLAHEIKNPLTSLLTFTRHLERRFDDPHFREKFHNVVPRELERINGIVERLLELARPARMSLTLEIGRAHV